MNIVIVDDSTEILLRMSALMYKLKSINIVGKAYDGHSALKMINLLKPDVVVLDIKLPGLNGMKVLQEVKQTYPGIIVIMLTNQQSSAYRKKCAELGCDYFYDKSNEFEMLVNTLSDLTKDNYVKKGYCS